MKRKLCSLVLALAMVLNLAACGQAASSSSAASSEPAASKEPAKTPAYSTEGFVTVDSDGNRVTTGRDATSTKAMATASKYEVSQVGAEIMSKGGNAVDAAVAMGFALGVCEPFTSGLGGGGLATIHTAEGENFFIDFREVAPRLPLWICMWMPAARTTATPRRAAWLPACPVRLPACCTCWSTTAP